jgi:nucleoside-diphosphate-sugar epimerase
MNLPIDDARRSSLASAKEIIALARQSARRGMLKKLEFVSTVGVGGRMPLVPETWITEKRPFHNTYEQAKAEAEDYLRDQMNRYGLPITLHRPSMVVGEARSGKIIHFQIFYYLCEFLAGRRTLGLVPDLAGVKLDTIPVDYVADALCWSSSRKETAGKVLHLCSGPDNAMDIDWLIGELRNFLSGRNVTLSPDIRLPLPLFRRALPLLKLLAPRSRRRALGIVPLFLDYAQDKQVFANENTVQILGSAGIDLPAPAYYVKNLLSAYFADR